MTRDECGKLRTPGGHDCDEGESRLAWDVSSDDEIDEPDDRQLAIFHGSFCKN